MLSLYIFMHFLVPFSCGWLKMVEGFEELQANLQEPRSVSTGDVRPSGYLVSSLRYGTGTRMRISVWFSEMREVTLGRIGLRL